jgi:hypothetical protein
MQVNQLSLTHPEVTAHPEVAPAASSSTPNLRLPENPARIVPKISPTPYLGILTS